jgi:hypothetical protein
LGGKVGEGAIAQVGFFGGNFDSVAASGIRFSSDFGATTAAQRRDGLGSAKRRHLPGIICADDGFGLTRDPPVDRGKTGEFQAVLEDFDFHIVPRGYTLICQLL